MTENLPIIQFKTEMSEEDAVFEVEAIRSHRTRKNCLQYFLKWKGYPESKNTWANAADLSCPKLLTAYWQERNESVPQISHSKQSDRSKPRKPRSPKKSEDIWPFDSKLVRILGVTDRCEQNISLYVELNNGEKVVLNSKLVKVHYPLLLARFYEKHITAMPPANGKSSEKVSLTDIHLNG
jgi:hypothetical protein